GCAQMQVRDPDRSVVVFGFVVFLHRLGYRYEIVLTRITTIANDRQVTKTGHEANCGINAAIASSIQWVRYRILCEPAACRAAQPERIVMDSTTIYHNPKCSTSRNALALIRHTGVEPQIIEYLQSPPDRATLADLIKQAGLTVRDALRDKGPEYAELGLGNPDLSDDQLLDAMLAHPVLINRPFVVTPMGVRL